MTDLVVTQPTMTMSSREIEAVTGKRHDNVKRTIDSLVQMKVISYPQVEDRNSANGVAEKVYLVRERDSYIVVARLSPKHTERLVDRWLALEKDQANRVRAQNLHTQVQASLSGPVYAEMRRTAVDEAQKALLGITRRKVKSAIRSHLEGRGLPWSSPAEVVVELSEFYLKGASAFLKQEESETRELARISLRNGLCPPAAPVPLDNRAVRPQYHRRSRVKSGRLRPKTSQKVSNLAH